MAGLKKLHRGPETTQKKRKTIRKMRTRREGQESVPRKREK